MKYNSFFANLSLWLALCAGLMLSSCEKSPKLTVSPQNVTFDAFPEELIDIEISTAVNWTVTVIQNEEWLLVSPKSGKGNGTITLEAAEHHEFSERVARIAISGEGVKTDTVRVYQAPDADIQQYIKDETFREFCLENYDTDPSDGKISMKEARKVTFIDVSEMQISSLAGIDYFPKLTRLDCSYNKIESIDLSKNKELLNLNCSYNSIKSLDVSSNTEIKTIKCSDNPITHIDVSGLTKLTDLWIDNADLSSIDVSSNEKLEWLFISNNKLENIDVSHNPELMQLMCGENDLAELNVSNNTKLVTLYCGNNKFNSLNLDNNTALEDLYCTSNLLTVINLSKNVSLTGLNCAHNKLSSLNLSNCQYLTRLYCESNQLTELILSSNKALVYLHCDANLLTTLNLNNNTELSGFRCTYSKLQNSIDLSKNTKLAYIELQNNPNLKTISVWSSFVEKKEYIKDEDAKWVKIP